jgi:hypothetical protein
MTGTDLATEWDYATSGEHMGHSSKYRATNKLFSKKKSVLSSVLENVLGN